MNFDIDKILSFSNNNIHNHEPTTDHNLAVKCIRTAIKGKPKKTYMQDQIRLYVRKFKTLILFLRR
jgi:hypothetical protein